MSAMYYLEAILARPLPVAAVVIALGLQYLQWTAAQTQPASVALVVGSSTTLRCSAGSSLSFVQWLLYPTGSTSSTTVLSGTSCVNPTAVPGYGVNGTNAAVGQCDLIIPSVAGHQAGWYQCLMVGSSSSVNYVAQVTVLYSNPQCTQNVTSNVAVNDAVSMQCVVNYSSYGMNATMSWSGCTYQPASYTTTVNGSVTTTQYEIYTVVQQQQYLQTCNCSTTTGNPPTPPAAITGTPSTDVVRYSNVWQSQAGVNVQYCPYGVTLSPDDPLQPPGAVVTCTADSYPPPTYTLTVRESNETLTQTNSMVTLTTEGVYIVTCIATVQISSGQQGSRTCSNQSISVYYVESSNPGPTTAPVVPPSCCDTPCIVGIVVGVTVGVLIINVIVLIVCFRHSSCPLYKEDFCRVGKSKDYANVQYVNDPTSQQQQRQYADPSPTYTELNPASRDLQQQTLHHYQTLSA